MAIVALALLGLRPAGAAGQEELRSGALVFRFWRGETVVAATLAEAMAAAPSLPGLPDSILAYGDIIILLAPDKAIFDSLAPGVPDWSGGIAFPQGDRIVLPVFAPRAGGLPLATVLRHELAHVGLSRYLGARVPRWFHEGYAQFASGSWDAGDAWTLRFAMLFGELPALESLTLDFRGRRVQADHAYLLSFTAVEYLHRLGGANGFRLLLERWRDVGDLDLALRRTYGLTHGQFERMWRREVGRRYNWLLVLTQTAVYWTLLTILLLVLGYWKKRRDRRKLAALEAAVAAAAAAEAADGAGEPPENRPFGGAIDGFEEVG